MPYPVGVLRSLGLIVFPMHWVLTHASLSLTLEPKSTNGLGWHFAGSQVDDLHTTECLVYLDPFYLWRNKADISKVTARVLSGAASASRLDFGLTISSHSAQTIKDGQPQKGDQSLFLDPQRKSSLKHD